MKRINTERSMLSARSAKAKKHVSNLYQDGLEKAHLLDLKRQRIMKERLDKEKKECTFKPTISARARSVRSEKNENLEASGVYKRTVYWLEQK